MNKISKPNLIGISIVVCILITALILQISRRQDQLQNNYYVSVAKVLDYKKHQRKGITTSKHTLKLKFWDGKKFVTKLHDVEVGTYDTDDIVLGDLFILKISKSNPEFYEIFYNIKVDPKYGVKIP